MAVDQEFAAFRKWLVESRRDAETQIVTTGHVLEGPFDTDAKPGNGGLLKVRIRGQNDSVTLNCNKIVLSPYRAKQVGFFVVNKAGQVEERRFIATLSASYQRILDSFPPNSKFDSTELYAKIRRTDGGTQAHARRRWKELKYDYGFDVDSTDDRQFYWRGPSDVPTRDPYPRPDDNKLRADMLPHMEKNSDGEYECNYCGVAVQFAGAEDDEEENEGKRSRGLLDHRRPVFQGGDDTLDNLQVFCETCNNLKTTACNRCKRAYKCDECIWAHPERVRSNRVVFILNTETRNALRERLGDNIEEELRNVVFRIASGKLAVK